MIFLLLAILLVPAIAQADEKIVSVPRDQFIKVLGEVKQNKQFLAESQEWLTKYKDIFEKQRSYVETLEGLNETRKKETELLQEQNAALQKEIEEERQRKADMAWQKQAEWAGYGAAIPTAIIMLRKLVFKF